MLLKSKRRIKEGSIVFIPLLLLLIAFTGCKKDDKTDSKGDGTECISSELDGYRTIVQGSSSREYIIHVPASYDSNSPSPLVINFHGFGDCIANYSETIGEFYGLNSVADNNNFIVVYPQAVLREKGDFYWEPGDSGSEDISENDVYFTKQLIADISSEYNVDASRIYAVGYSNGGMMSYDLACTASDVIAAIGIMSGAMLFDACDVSDAYSSAIIFHGIGDEVLPYDGNQDYQSVDDVVNFWLDHNNIPASSLVSTELNNGDVVRNEYTGGNENTSVILYTVNTEFGKAGGHVWFSEEIDEVNPNQILWDFLSTYSLND